jgi:hypothetical protein
MVLPGYPTKTTASEMFKTVFGQAISEAALRFVGYPGKTITVKIIDVYNQSPGKTAGNKILAL